MNNNELQIPNPIMVPRIMLNFNHPVKQLILVKNINNMTPEEKEQSKINMRNRILREEHYNKMRKQQYNNKMRMKVLIRKIKKLRKIIRSNISNALDIIVMEGYENEWSALNISYWYDYKFYKYHKN